MCHYRSLCEGALHSHGGFICLQSCVFITGYESRLTQHLTQRVHEKRTQELGRDPSNIIRHPSHGFMHLFKVDETEVEKKKREEKELAK